MNTKTLPLFAKTSLVQTFHRGMKERLKAAIFAFLNKQTSAVTSMRETQNLKTHQDLSIW